MPSPPEGASVLQLHLRKNLGKKEDCSEEADVTIFTYLLVVVAIFLKLLENFQSPVNRKSGHTRATFSLSHSTLDKHVLNLWHLLNKPHHTT